MNGWSVAERSVQKAEHTYTPCNTDVHYQRSSCQGRNMGRGECCQTSYEWHKVQVGQLRKRTGCDRQG